MKPPAPLLLSLRAAAALAGLTPVQLDKLRKAGVVFAVKLRRKHKFLREEMWRLRTPHRRAEDSAPYPLDLCGFRSTALPTTPETATKPVQ